MFRLKSFEIETDSLKNLCVLFSWTNIFRLIGLHRLLPPQRHRTIVKMLSGESGDCDDDCGGADIMGEFVDAENKEIARRHADLQRKNQVHQVLADFTLLLSSHRSFPAAVLSSTPVLCPWTPPS